MLLERLPDPFELGVRLRHLLLQFSHRFGRPDAGDDVFALGVDEEFAVELLRAIGRIARKRDAGPRRVTRVAVHHRLHVDGRAPLGRDVVLPPVDDRPVVHPRSEHRAHRAHELIPWRVRKPLADALLHERLETRDQFLEIVDGEFRIFDVVVMALMLERLDDGFKRLVILVRTLLHAEHDVAVHLDEPAVAVPRKARVAGLLRQGLDRLVVQAKIENRVHHAGHRIARAGPDGHEQRVLQVAERLARLLLERRHTRLHLAFQRRRIRSLAGVVVRADVRRDREPGRHGQSDAAHLGEIRALAAEQRLHRPVAVRLPAEVVDVLAGCRRLVRRLHADRARPFAARLSRRSRCLCVLRHVFLSTPMSRFQKYRQAAGSMSRGVSRGANAPDGRAGRRS